MEPDFFVPGDQQYQMVNEPLQPTGIAPLLPENEMRLPDFKKVAGNIIKNKAIEYAAGKIGLNAAQATGLAGLIGIGSNVFAPLAAVSALTGRSLGISEYLNNKRAQKQIKKQQTMNDAASITNRIQGQITPQDIIDDRGRGQIPSRTTPSAPKSIGVSNPYSGGIGGIQSGL
tara:strand:- start:97 stop:615 length:519 start_codon:yes stop_codon:yes gene_type:complete